MLQQLTKASVAPPQWKHRPIGSVPALAPKRSVDRRSKTKSDPFHPAASRVPRRLGGASATSGGASATAAASGAASAASASAAGGVVGGGVERAGGEGVAVVLDPALQLVHLLEAALLQLRREDLAADPARAVHHHRRLRRLGAAARQTKRLRLELGEGVALWALGAVEAADVPLVLVAHVEHADVGRVALGEHPLPLLRRHVLAAVGEVDGGAVGHLRHERLVLDAQPREGELVHRVLLEQQPLRRELGGDKVAVLGARGRQPAHLRVHPVRREVHAARHLARRQEVAVPVDRRLRLGHRRNHVEGEHARRQRRVEQRVDRHGRRERRAEPHAGARAGASDDDAGKYSSARGQKRPREDGHGQDGHHLSWDHAARAEVNASSIRVLLAVLQ